MKEIEIEKVKSGEYLQCIKGVYPRLQLGCLEGWITLGPANRPGRKEN